MIWDRELEQVFLRRKSGRIEVSLVLEDPAGGRHRESLPLDATDPRTAVVTLARLLARRGDVVGAPRLRVREERAAGLADRDDLRDAFREAFDRERDA